MSFDSKAIQGKGPVACCTHENCGHAELGQTGRQKLHLEKAQVLGNERIAPDVYLMELTAPYCAAHCKPGQFIHLRLYDNPAELLRLPFSVYECISSYGSIEVMYQVLGEGTRHMARYTVGETCDLIGPVGRGWNPPVETKRALLVGGGLGIAPMNMLARELHAAGVAVDVAVGAPTKKRLLGVDRLAAYAQIYEATDDGSCGVDGFCTQVSKDLLSKHEYGYIATCGPEPMQGIVAAQAAEAGIPCEVSLERLMACGIGACLSCVVKTRSGQKRACVDGPVFDAKEVF